MLSRSRLAQSSARMPPQAAGSRAIEAAALSTPDSGAGGDRTAIQTQHWASLRCSGAGRYPLEAPAGTISADSRLRANPGAGEGLMQKAEEQLASIGFGGSRNEPACWRAV